MDLTDAEVRADLVARLAGLYAGRPVILGPGVLAGYTPRVAELGRHGCRVLVLSTARGAGPVPDRDECWMVDIVAANRPRMKRDRAHLSRPPHDGHLRGADLVRVATRWELDLRGLHVVRGSLRDALLKEGVAAALLARRDHDARMHALRPALERRGPVVERPHDAFLDGEVVLDHVELGDHP